MKKFIAFILVFSFLFMLPVYSYYELYKLYKVADYINVNNQKIKIDKPILQYGKDYYVPLEVATSVFSLNAKIDTKAHTLNIKNKTNIDYLKIQLKDLSFSVYIQIVDNNGVLKSNASGTIVEKDILLTCYHVIDQVDNCNNIKIISENNILLSTNKYIKLISNNQNIYSSEYDKYSFCALEVLYVDKNRDIAILRIPETNLNPIKLGDSDKYELLDEVFTVSSPLGFFNTVTKGNITGFRYYKNQNFIQTDATTNDGSSGGAIININGELIGIIQSTLDSTNNINLSIPINEVKDSIKKYSK